MDIYLSMLMYGVGVFIFAYNLGMIHCLKEYRRRYKSDSNKNKILTSRKPKKRTGPVKKVYVLKKDLPGIKKGAKFQQSSIDDDIYFHGIPISSESPGKVGIIRFDSEYVEANEKWFKLDEE